MRTNPKTRLQRKSRRCSLLCETLECRRLLSVNLDSIDDDTGSGNSDWVTNDRRLTFGGSTSYSNSCGNHDSITVFLSGGPSGWNEKSVASDTSIDYFFWSAGMSQDLADGTYEAFATTELL